MILGSISAILQSDEIVSQIMNSDTMDQIVEDNKNLVYSIAKRRYNSAERSNEFQDYIGFGYLGLVEAIAKFNGDEKYFPTYAKHRIEGSIIEGIYGKKSKREAMKDNDINFVSTDEINDLHCLIENGVIDSIHIKEMEIIIKESIENKLNKKEKNVILNMYYENMVMADIAKMMRISAGRVSQIHKKAIEKLSSVIKTEILQGA